MSRQIKPSIDELEEAKKIMNKALSVAEKELPMDQEVIVEMGWTESEFVIEEMDGASGYAKYPNILDIDFNTTSQKWRESLRTSSFHEYAHIWDYSQRGQKWEKRWQYILGEALSQHFAAQNAKYSSPWRTEYSREEVAEHWPKIRDEEIHKEMDEVAPNGVDPLFVNRGDEGYPNWLGYSLAWQIGERLLQDHSLEDFPELEKQDVVEAGNELYTE